MTEWWTYRPDDLLLYSARTYYRLFELVHQDIWPLQIAAGLAGLLVIASALSRRSRSARIVAALLAASWAWVAWDFHLERYATIHWMAPTFAAAFTLQAALLLAWALAGTGVQAAAAPRGTWPGRLLIAFAVAGYPLLGPLSGRPWVQAGLFALMPDPTALATLGWLLLTPGASDAPRWHRVLAAARWPIPLAWCGYSATMLAVMGSPEAGVLALSPLLAIGAAWRTRPGGRPRQR